VVAVGAENQYANVIGQIGGKYVRVAAEVDEQAAAETPAVTASTASTIPRRDSRESMVKLLQSRFNARRAEAHRLNTNENDNQYEYRGQAVRPLPGRRRAWREIGGRRVAGRRRRGASSPPAGWVVFAQEVPDGPGRRPSRGFAGR
jgi:hypothetical protein